MLPESTAMIMIYNYCVLTNLKDEDGRTCMRDCSGTLPIRPVRRITWSVCGIMWSIIAPPRGPQAGPGGAEPDCSQAKATIEREHRF